MADEAISQPQAPVTPKRSRSLKGRVFGTRPGQVMQRSVMILAGLFVLYFGVLGGILHRIDADVDFTPPNPIAGGSRAISMAEALIYREVNTYRWSPNDPWFFPTVFWDNHQNFQRGMMRSISRFVLEMEVQIGRLRGTSAIDPDLQRASGLLQFPTDVWLFDFDQSFLPVQPADVQYAAAARALRNYNTRVAAGRAVFETRPDALAVVIERMNDELGARAAIIDEHTALNRFIIDILADDIFYFNKGASYAAYLMLRELGADFEQVITGLNLTRIWNTAIESLREAGRQRPLVVLNSSGVNSFLANHLQIQGFYLKRAVLQFDEAARAVRGNR